jgi:hypothetical protein
VADGLAARLRLMDRFAVGLLDAFREVLRRHVPAE